MDFISGVMIGGVIGVVVGLFLRIAKSQDKLMERVFTGELSDWVTCPVCDHLFRKDHPR